MTIEYKVRRTAKGVFVRYKCPRCSAVLNSPIGIAGKRGQCPDCQLDIEVPGSEEAEAETRRAAADGVSPPRAPLAPVAPHEPTEGEPRLSSGATTVIGVTYGMMLAAAGWVGLSFVGASGKAETVLQQNAAAAEACAMLLFLYAVARGIEKLARVSCGLQKTPSSDESADITKKSRLQSLFRGGQPRG